MKYFINKLYSKYLWSTLAVFVLIAYIFSVTFGLKPGMFIFGLPILFYFPGRFLVDIAPAASAGSKAFGRFSFSVIYSFCLSALLAYLVEQLIGFNSPWQTWSILILNVLLLVVRASLRRDLNKGEKLSFSDFVGPLILALAILAVVLLNPYAQNLDNYLNILKQSISSGSNLLLNRKIFVSSLASYHQILAFDPVLIYRHLLVALFFGSTLSLYDYLRRNLKSKQTVIICYLAFLIPPAILIEVNRIMPQVVLLSTTTIILLLLAGSLKDRRVSYSIIAVFLSAFSLLFHELSAILLAISMLVVVINFCRLTFTDKKIPGAVWWIVLSALAIIVSLRPQFFWSVIDRPITRFLLGFGFVRGQGGLTWKWWFINNYKTVEDTQLGWTGIGALYYYLYGGILVLFLLLCLYLYMRRKRVETGLYLLPVGLHFFFYFFAAEIMPRLNYAFLPNRAWIHMMLSSLIMIVLVMEKMEAKKVKVNFLLAMVVSMILVGYAGTLYIAKNYIYEVYPDEIKAVKFIRQNTNKDSLILSSQSNMSLVSIYAERRSGYVLFDRCINKLGFARGVNKTLDQLSSERLIEEPQFLQSSGNYYRSEDNPDLLTERKFNDGKNSVYFLYSYRKVGGLNNQREYRQAVVDSANGSNYKNFGYPIVYQDSNTIILKIR